MLLALKAIVLAALAVYLVLVLLVGALLIYDWWTEGR